ncbi:MAG: hypothetical protein AB8G77_09125 [Rhodothermales bacterium]
MQRTYRRALLYMAHLVLLIALSPILAFGQTQSSEFLDVFVEDGYRGLLDPQGIVFGQDGHLYIASEESNQVLRFNGLTGDFIDVFVGTANGGLKEPKGIAFGPDENLYVSSLWTNQVLRYNGITGHFLGSFIDLENEGHEGPYDVVFGPDGNAYVSAEDAVLRSMERPASLWAGLTTAEQA